MNKPLPRPYTYLKLYSEGLSTPEIAFTFRRSERTIERVIKKHLEEHGLKTREQAIAHAIRNRII